MSTYKYYSPKCTFFGYGCLASVGGEIKANGYKKALVVTDTSLIKLGIAGKVTDMLEKASIPYAIFDGVRPNPTVTTVNEGFAFVKEHGCDFLVSIGGGSAHDSAKAISILATNGGDIRDYKGVDMSKVAPLPIVAVNTTAGTASECTRAYVIVDEETGSKYGCRDKNIIPAIAVDDHELMMNLPAKLTAGTGMDALTHAVECYTSVNSFGLTSALALAAVREVFLHLPGAVLNSNEVNRAGMTTGQYLAGMAFGNGGCGLVHSMSHQLSAVYDLPHGLSNAILLPAVMEFNCKDEKAQLQYGELAWSLFPLECIGKTDVEKAAVFIAKTRELSKQIGTMIPLGVLGVRKEDLTMLAEKAMHDGSLGNNPVQPTVEQVAELYEALL